MSIAQPANNVIVTLEIKIYFYENKHLRYRIGLTQVFFDSNLLTPCDKTV